ncbi:hypothetical protein ABZ924_12515 [Streptomyces sp. NPDC046876]|uniref:hypothetical protein n=1 Tax=Streptomyces sp. NPDC046876 TaxID=3155616 RepID=UPI0033F60E40
MRSALIAVRTGGVAVALAALAAVSAPPTALAAEEVRGSVSVDPHQGEPGAQVKLRVRGCDGRWAAATSAVFVADANLSSGRDGDRTLGGDAMISSRAQPGWHDIRVSCDGEEVRGSVEVVRHREGDDRDKEREKEQEKGRDKERDKERDQGRDESRDQGRDESRDQGRDESRDQGQGRDEHPDAHRTPSKPSHAGGGGMAAKLAEADRLARTQSGAQAGTGAGAAAQDQAAAAKKSHGGDGPGLPHTVIGAVLAAAATLAVAGRALALRRRRSGE